jgi:alpha-tubulin suppressor-like RCC1 family protein
MSLTDKRRCAMQRTMLMGLGMLALTTLPACQEDLHSPTAPRVEGLPLLAARTALTFQQVSAGGSHGCGVTIDRRAYCWGLNYNGQLRIGHTTQPIDSPVAVATTLRFRSVSAGGNFTCGVTGAGALYCWGENGDGQLGNGTTTGSPQPVRVQTGARMREVSAGTHHACAVSVGHILYCWGRNDFGQVGDGSVAQRSVPTRTLGLAHFSTVSAGDEFTCGVTTANAGTRPHRAYCWGAASNGHYGSQTTRDKTLQPRAVAGEVAFDSVQSGLTHVCGMTLKHQAYCWGADNWWLGSPRSGSNFQVSPRLVAGGQAFRSVDTGIYWTCGVTVEGRAFCWGRRGVGDGTTVGSPVPVHVGGQLRFRAVSTGGQFSCGLTKDGKVYCWGDADRLTPTLLGSGT